MLLHLNVGEHVSENELADLQHNIYDKLKRDWVAIFAKVQTKDCQPQHCQIDSTCAQREKFIAEDMHVWPKKMLRKCYMLADVIIFVYEVPCIFWHYINVDEVSWITLKKLLQSAMELLQIATA